MLRIPNLARDRRGRELNPRNINALR